MGFTDDSEAQSFADQIWNVFLGGSSDNRPFGSVVLDGSVPMSSSLCMSLIMVTAWTWISRVAQRLDMRPSLQSSAHTSPPQTRGEDESLSRTASRR